MARSFWPGRRRAPAIWVRNSNGTNGRVGVQNSNLSKLLRWDWNLEKSIATGTHNSESLDHLERRLAAPAVKREAEEDWSRRVDPASPEQGLTGHSAPITCAAVLRTDRRLQLEAPAFHHSSTSISVTTIHGTASLNTACRRTFSPGTFTCPTPGSQMSTDNLPFFMPFITPQGISNTSVKSDGWQAVVAKAPALSLSRSASESRRRKG